MKTPLDNAQQSDAIALREHLVDNIEALSESKDFLYHYVRATMPRALRPFMGASDIVQSVLMRVNDGMKDFRGCNQYQFRRWVIQIARHRILDGIRQYRLSIAQREDNAQICPNSPKLRAEDHVDPLDHLVLEEQVSEILSAIAALPEEIREIVVLRYSHELSFIEIAERMGLPVTTCRRRWLEGCEFLRSQLRSILY